MKERIQHELMQYESEKKAAEWKRKKEIKIENERASDREQKSEKSCGNNPLRM